MAAELKPCPLCGGAMSVRTNRDWHRLVGEHAEDCLMQDFEPYYAATPRDREVLVAAWNRRVPDGVSEPGQQTFRTADADGAGDADPT